MAYQSMADLYSSSVTNPNHIVPVTATAGQEQIVHAIGNVLGNNAPASDVRDALKGYVNTMDYSSGGSSSSIPTYTSSGGGSSGGWGGGWGGGGGGGGGGGNAGITQGQLDWISDLLARGEPDPAKASRLKLPAYRSKFHPQMYNQLARRFNRAVGMDRRTSNRAYNNLARFTRNNFRNAYTGPNARFATMAQAPGMDQRQMARLMQNQGIDPSVAGAQMEGAAAADQGFRNLWAVLGANERQAQQNRLANIRQDRMTTNAGLAAAALQGRTGIGLQKAQAKDEWRTRLEDARNQLRQQQALANWQRGNQVSDLNLTNSTSFRNNLISAMIGLIPDLKEGVDMPDIGTLLGLPEPPKKPGKGKGGKKKGGKKGGGGEGKK